MQVNDFIPLNYAHLITTKPHAIRRVVISDLHLSADEPALVQAFLALLDDLIALSNLEEFYILGDWFDTWIGDDAYLSLSTLEKQSHWLTPLIESMKHLSQNGCQIFIMHGNRDFLIGQSFCDTFYGKLISEPYYLHIGDQLFRLEHGDALCTDDKAYQRFRKLMRHSLVQWLLLKQPLSKRQALAQRIKQQSSRDKSKKSMTIMDVNKTAVVNALSDADNLLHGHTHRPNTHQITVKPFNHTLHKSSRCTTTKTRYVLGDWRIINPQSSYQKVEAIIGISIQAEHIQQSIPKQTETFSLVEFCY